jgi:protein-S-isoprenylcysteine O-methyltransferase Ste14
MTKKNAWIEIFPRALWVSKFVLLVSTQYIFINKPQLTNNTFKLVLGILLSAVGFCFWIYITRYMHIKGSFSSKKELCTAGPFKYIRHPMYVSVYIMLTGLGLLFFAWIWFVLMIVFIPIWYGVSKMEENHMTGIWKEQYLDYKRKTGMFFPKFKLKKR